MTTHVLFLFQLQNMQFLQNFILSSQNFAAAIYFRTMTYTSLSVQMHNISV